MAKVVLFGGKQMIRNWSEVLLQRVCRVLVVAISVVVLSCDTTTIYDNFVLDISSQENVDGIRLIAISTQDGLRVVYDTDADSDVSKVLGDLSKYDLVNGSFELALATGLQGDPDVKLLVYGYKDVISRKPTVAFAGIVNLAVRGPRSIYLRSIGAECDEDSDGALNCSIPGCCVGTSYDIALKDCDDVDANVSPYVNGPPACIPCNAPDYTCGGAPAVCVDNDNDGVADCLPEDCDSNDPDIHSNHAEVCDLKDNDCDGDVDEGYPTGGACKQGVGSCENSGTVVCAPNGFDVVCNVTGVDKGTACDDGDPCTEDDTCTGGNNSVCIGVPKLCDDLLDCTTDSCVDGNCLAEILLNTCLIDGECFGAGDEGDAQCLECNPEEDNQDWSPVADGTFCDDQDACTSGDGCAGGVCVGGLTVNCDDSVSCTVDSCDSAFGCTHVADSGQCDDSNPCTDNQCSPTRGCVFPNNTNLCDDGSVCTTDDACVGGTCSGDQLDCNDGIFCTIDVCMDETGCEHQPSDNLCDDSNPCTTDICVPEVGCDYLPAAGACDDKNACTSGDFCTEMACSGGFPTICNDGNQCTDDSCDMTKGCVTTKVAKSCDDGNACTSGDTCVDGVCKFTKIVNCSDNNPCTDDSCDTVLGCQSSANNQPCQDGNACTEGDVCKNKVCTSGAAKFCDDGNPCTFDDCFQATGCSFTNVSVGCDDGNPCTLADKCTGGVCVPGSTKNCDDKDVCTVDSCSSLDGSCINTYVQGPGCP